MEFARKYRLIPFDQDQQFNEEHLSDLDKQITDILKKKITDDEKAKLYVQALQKFVTFPNVNSKNPSQEEKQTNGNNTDIESKIFQTVPLRHKGIAQRIINFLKEKNITWTENKELSLNNKVIDGSNVIELINFLLRSRTKKPVAFEKFKEILDENNFPQHFIKNSYLTNTNTLYAKPVPKKRKVSSKYWLKL